MADRRSFISTKVTGASKVKDVLSRYLVGAELLFAQERLEKLLVSRTKARLDTLGSSKVAQRDAAGKRFSRHSPNTSGSDSTRILHRTGALQDGIRVVRSRMRRLDVQSSTGGGFRIGVRGKAEAYAAVHQRGGFSGRNNKVRIPQRRFLGVSPSDVKAVNRLMSRLMLGSV